jgi:hypothetical protein
MTVMVKVSSSSPAFSSLTRSCNFMKCAIISVLIMFFLLVLLQTFPSSFSSSEKNLESLEVASPYFHPKTGTLRDSSSSSSSNRRVIKATTWNIAAINNNPFEYWVTFDEKDNAGASYNSLMKKVAGFINNPGEADIGISEVFSDKMFNELIEEMKENKIAGWNETIAFWENDFKRRKIISQFIKDPILGKKRLISMPDRVTNTINTVRSSSSSSSSSSTVYRPAVINCYPQQLSSYNDWWKEWKKFMFHTPLSSASSSASSSSSFVYHMIPKIEKSKYPIITSEEEKISVPLGILSLALFDSILIHMMNSLEPKEWQSIRQKICFQCNYQKQNRTLEILLSSYNDSDIIFLQEVAGRFFDNILGLSSPSSIFSSFDVISSSLLDKDRDQNSFILLKKNQYFDIKEVTKEVMTILDEMYASSSRGEGKKKKNPVVKGDLIVITAVDKRDKSHYLLASFHGDTNGFVFLVCFSLLFSIAVSYFILDWQPSQLWRHFIPTLSNINRLLSFFLV